MLRLIQSKLFDEVRVTVFKMLPQISRIAGEITTTRSGSLTYLTICDIGIFLRFPEKIPDKRAFLPFARRSIGSSGQIKVVTRRFTAKLVRLLNGATDSSGGHLGRSSWIRKWSIKKRGRMTSRRACDRWDACGGEGGWTGAFATRIDRTLVLTLMLTLMLNMGIGGNIGGRVGNRTWGLGGWAR